jgi:hypothetical protein
MAFVEIGDRVFAVESADNKEVRLLGFGVYVGDEVPPAPFGILSMGATTWEEFDELVAKDDLVPVDLRPFRKTNPKIQLDDGRVVWGYECWWGREDRYEDFRRQRAEVRAHG